MAYRCQWIIRAVADSIAHRLLETIDDAVFLQIFTSFNVMGTGHTRVS